ncbi:MAG TPA: PfkB family carbohydrate kinase [Clostridia bacterium]
MRLSYDKVVGTGGIGTGLLFHSLSNDTLGRSESRLVELSDARDYCKLHIVFHYVSTLLSPDAAVYPIGCVGNDMYGKSLLSEMRQAGMDTSYVKTDESLPTVISICLQYPDKEGCNFTAANGAGMRVTTQYVSACVQKMAMDARTIVAAIPEVSVDSRVALLEAGRQSGAFCVLSVPVSEAAAFEKAQAYRYCDLLAVNEEEARAIAHSTGDFAEVAEKLCERLGHFNEKILLLMTCGKAGAITVSDGHVESIPSLPAQAVNTTGAGDACLGGTLAGLALGLPFQKGVNDRRFGETRITSAAELGTLCAGMAIESEDSIALHVNRKNILDKIRQNGWPAAERFI